MARSRIDHEGVSAARHALTGDPATLHASADAVAASAAYAMTGVSPDADGLVSAMARHRQVHAAALDAVAAAAAALGGALDVTVSAGRELELGTALSFSSQLSGAR